MDSNEVVKHVRYRAEDWRVLVSEFSESNLDREVFCHNKQISPLRLIYWQRIFGLDELDSPRSRSPFVDLGLLKPQTSTLDLKLDLGDGVVLTITRR